jgi:hypothetical protein
MAKLKKMAKTCNNCKFKNQIFENDIYKIGRIYKYNLQVSKDGRNYFLNKSNNGIIKLETKKSKSTLRNIYMIITGDSILNNQIKIIYLYKFEKIDFENLEFTGLIQKEYFYLHPPRSNGLSILEFCAFPYCYLAPNSKLEYTLNSIIYKGWDVSAWLNVDFTQKQFYPNYNYQASVKDEIVKITASFEELWYNK